MKKTKTNRGFDLYNFTDRYDRACSLQESSIATERCIWLGVDEPDPKRCVFGKGWVSYPLPDDVQCVTRMQGNGIA